MVEGNLSLPLLMSIAAACHAACISLVVATLWRSHLTMSNVCSEDKVGVYYKAHF